jgi:endo-alpha-1,4-polygalactosaminidase (GH114 family)
VKQPNEYTADQVRAQLIAIEEQLVVIESEAPEMQSRHLRRMKEDAESKGQERRVAGIKAVIEREESASRHRNVDLTTKKRKGGGKVFKVECADAEGNFITYCTKGMLKL